MKPKLSFLQKPELNLKQKLNVLLQSPKKIKVILAYQE
jgi:hypothetical protein